MHVQILYRFALAALIIFYVSIRLWHLTDSCLWFDEIFSVHAAEHSWAELFPFVAKDLIHPPFFYALLKIWIGIGGENILWLRVLSVLIASIALIPFLLICKQFELPSSVILTAMLLFAVNASVIKYSQEVRMYSLLMCLSLFSFWLFVRLHRNVRGIAVLAFVNTLLVYTHYFGWFVVLSEIIFGIFWNRARIRQTLLMSAGILAAFLPWLFWLWSVSRKSGALQENIGWIQRPRLGDLAGFLLSVVEPFYFPRISTDNMSDYRISVPLLTIFAVALISFFCFEKSNENGQSKSQFLLVFTLTPLISAFILSWFLPYSIWGIRHLIIILPLLIILLAIAINEFPMRSFRLAAIALIVLFSGYAFVVEIRRPEIHYSWCDWASLESRIPAVSSERSVKIYVFEDLVAYHLWFNIRQRGDKYLVNKITGIEGLAEDKAYFLPRGFDGVRKMGISEISDEQFWIAFRTTESDVTKPPLSEFILRGYRVGESLSSQADDSKLFLVPIEK
jgi:mannosyltransferase